MEEHKNLVEAVLFTTGKFLSIEDISKLTGIASQGYLKQILEQIKKDYEDRNSSLEILNDNNKWKLNIKKQYLHLTEKLLTDSELSKPVQETLAVIAFKQPVFQSELIKIRSNKAYEHVKILEEQSFIISEKSGRTKILKLTPKFYDYFDVIESQLKSKLLQKNENSNQ